MINAGGVSSFRPPSSSSRQANRGSCDHHPARCSRRAAPSVAARQTAPQKIGRSQPGAARAYIRRTRPTGRLPRQAACLGARRNQQRPRRNRRRDLAPQLEDLHRNSPITALRRRLRHRPSGDLVITLATHLGHSPGRRRRPTSTAACCWRRAPPGKRFEILRRHWWRFKGRQDRLAPGGRGRPVHDAAARPYPRILLARRKTRGTRTGNEPCARSRLLVCGARSPPLPRRS